jgi:hypothetical protein
LKADPAEMARILAARQMRGKGLRAPFDPSLQLGLQVGIGRGKGREGVF